MDPDELEILFKSMLAYGMVPKTLKLCRTTLIPKKGDLKNVSNWRPIAITSILLRCFIKILNAKLFRITINLAQKGFRKIDGSAANALLIQSLIL